MEEQNLNALQAVELMLSIYDLSFTPGCPFLVPDDLFQFPLTSNAPNDISGYLRSLLRYFPMATLAQGPGSAVVLPSPPSFNRNAVGFVLPNSDGGPGGLGGWSKMVIVCGEIVFITNILRSSVVVGAQPTAARAVKWMGVVQEASLSRSVSLIGGGGSSEVRVSICGAFSEY